MSGRKKLTGTVQDGSGASERLFSEGHYDQHYGFEPYPGTLNLKVGSDIVDDLLRGDPERMFRIGQEIWLWQAVIGCPGDDTPMDVWVSVPTMTTKDHIEIIAPVHLRRRLGVENGDKVTVTFTGSPNDNTHDTVTYDVIRPIEGAALQAGKAYHDIPGIAGPSYRKGTEKRVDHFAKYIPTDGVGLDLACSVGGLSIALAERGATMFGYDYDSSAIAIGNRVAKNRGLPVALKLTDMSTQEGWDVILEDAENCNFAIWMSNWMWIAKQAGPGLARRWLEDLSEVVPVLVFETAEGNGSMAGSAGLRNSADVKRMLSGNTAYTNFNCIGHPDAGWHPRNVFICSR